MKPDRIITQIGSLPYDNVPDAIAYSLRHDIPFLPELPKLGDAMMAYIKEPGRMSCLREFKKHAFEAVKVQCVGPATLILAGYPEDEAITRCYEHISAILDGLKAEEIILFLDEPALGQAGFDYRKMWDAIFSSFSVVPGIHTCGNMNWDDMFDSNIKIISFDASQFDLTKYPKYRNGKKIAWGVVNRPDVKDFAAGDLLTLPCGIGSSLYSVNDCEEKLDKLVEIKTSLTGGGGK
ncbi:MAG: hypothetical protein ABH885_04680 [Candidatus Omnitrophota bacterium]